MDNRTFAAYLRRLEALKKARRAYEDAEIEHLRFRKAGATGKLPGEKSFRNAIYQTCIKMEIRNLKALDND